MKQNEGHTKSDLKNRFYSRQLEKGENFLCKNADKTNHLIFILAGDMEVIFGGLNPRVISGGNMIFLTPLSNCVCNALSPVDVTVLEVDGLNYSCDKFLFQRLTPIYTLLKYEFRELDIRRPIHIFLELIKEYLYYNIPLADLYAEKMKELFILFQVYYNAEELTMFFYPLLGKNMEFKKMITDNFLQVKNVKEYAALCGYSMGVFQRKFKDVFGETVYQWMQRQKAEQIKHRLMTGEVNLTEMAEELGFASPAHLNKFCKVWFGMTPSELRQTFLLKKNLR